MAKAFTERSRLYSIRHCEQFKSFKNYVLAPRRYARLMQLYRLKDLHLFYPLNAEVVANALNGMKELAAENRFFYHAFAKKDTGVYAFLPKERAAFVLIMPGGGYGDVCSLVEGYSTAVAFLRAGYGAFIVNYSVGKAARYPSPTEDVAAALGYIFSKSQEFGVQESYAVCGFSAGGHLAGLWCTRRHGYEKYNLAAPKAAFLCYPVITMSEPSGRRKQIAGDDAKLYASLSLERHAADFPPTFLWQCKGDRVVPFRNSLRMAEALKASGVPYRFMPAEGTGHGWGTAEGTPAEGWLQRAVEFWKESEEGER